MCVSFVNIFNDHVIIKSTDKRIHLTEEQKLDFWRNNCRKQEKEQKYPTEFII